MNLKQLRKKRAQLVREAEALRAKDGSFANDQARADFDAKMAGVETIDEQIRALETPDEEPEPDAASELAAGANAERERITGIQDAVRIAKLEPSVAERLVKDNVSMDEARKRIFAQLAQTSEQTPTTQHIRLGEDARDKTVRGITAWLLTRAGMAGLIRQAAEQRKDMVALHDVTLDPGEFRGFRLLDLARETLERRALATRGKSPMEIARLALRATGMQTTSDFAVALENALHKVLLAAYATAPDTWRRFCGIRSVTDFRDHPVYRRGSIARLDKVLQHGEFKNKTLPDTEKEKIKAETFGNLIAITRQTIVNDDMGFLNDVAMMFGRAAGLSIELEVFDTLALNSNRGPTMNDTKALFHADHNNISTATALTIANLDTDATKMAEQKDPSGNEVLDLRPYVLLVPIGLRGQAIQLANAEFEDFNRGKPNRIRGVFTDIVGTARLSGTRRFLFANPATDPAIAVAFLDGQQEPLVESQDEFTVDGVVWKVRHDFGVAGVDFRTAIVNDGV